ncbi:hypothetical protein KJ657_00120, partial [Patescibacteria group bacterium]|nr:hypothetical protein [Patescibacteria group bacterium]
MLIKKENYREFENSRLVWGGFDKPHEVSATKAKKEETSEDKQGAIEDRSSVISAHRTSADNLITNMVKKAESWQKGAAAKLANALRAHARTKFDEISGQYNAKRKEEEEVFTKSPEARKIEKRAEELFSRINERIGTPERARTYLEHQTRQDRMEKAQTIKKKPEDIEKKVTAEKQKIVEKYLETAEETKGITNPKTRAMLARLIVEGRLVTLEGPDLDAYKNDLEAFFTAVDKFNENIGSTLKGKVEKVVQLFLAEIPKVEAKPDEIAELTKIITSDNQPGGLLDKFGTSTYMWTAVDALARKYDMHFREGKLLYATDLTTQNVYDADSFRKKITDELKNPDFYDENAIRKYSEKVDEDTSGLTSLREEIDEGLVTVAEGGEITEWDDWAGHSAVEKLMQFQSEIKEQSGPIETRENQRAAREREEAQKQKNLDAYYDAAEAADLAGAIKKATDDGYTDKSPENSAKPNPEGPYEGYQVLENATDAVNLRITINLDSKGIITVTINPIDANKEGRYFNAEYRFTKPEDFKAKAGDLAALGKKTKKNWINNNKELKRIDDALAKVKINDLQIKSEHGETSERFRDDFTPNNPTLMIGDHQVGTLTFHPKPTTGAAEVTINISGQKPEKVTVTQLNAKLRAQLPKMKEVAKRADKNKTEITKQLNTDPLKLSAGENLSFIPEKETTGNFSNPEELIRVGTFNKNDDKKTLAATLYITAGAPEGKPGEPAKPRPYTLREAGKDDMSFASIDKVKKYIDQNRARLAEIPQEPKPVELTSGREKAKENLTKIVMTIWGDKMTGIKPDAPEFSNALNTFLKGLTPERAAALEKPDAALTPQEQVNLHNAFKEAYYEKLEAVDENEVKIVGALPVTVKDKQPSTFAAVFGPNLPRILSMSHEFRADANGSLKVKKGDQFMVVDANGMREYVPARMRENYDKVLSGEDPKALQEQAGEEVRTREAMQKFGEIMKNPKAAKAFKEMGLGELIASLAQLWKMFQTAFKTGDFKSLEDGLKDFQEGRNPIERIESAKKAYE